MKEHSLNTTTYKNIGANFAHWDSDQGELSMPPSQIDLNPTALDKKPDRAPVLRPLFKSWTMSAITLLNITMAGSLTLPSPSWADGGSSTGGGMTRPATPLYDPKQVQHAIQVAEKLLPDIFNRLETQFNSAMVQPQNGLQLNSLIFRLFGTGKELKKYPRSRPIDLAFARHQVWFKTEGPCDSPVTPSGEDGSATAEGSICISIPAALSKWHIETAIEKAILLLAREITHIDPIKFNEAEADEFERELSLVISGRVSSDFFYKNYFPTFNLPADATRKAIISEIDSLDLTLRDAQEILHQSKQGQEIKTLCQFAASVIFPKMTSFTKRLDKLNSWSDQDDSIAAPWAPAPLRLVHAFGSSLGKFDFMYFQTCLAHTNFNALAKKSADQYIARLNKAKDQGRDIRPEGLAEQGLSLKILSYIAKKWPQGKSKIPYSHLVSLVNESFTIVIGDSLYNKLTKDFGCKSDDQQCIDSVKESIRLHKIYEQTYEITPHDIFVRRIDLKAPKAQTLMSLQAELTELREILQKNKEYFR